MKEIALAAAALALLAACSREESHPFAGTTPPSPSKPRPEKVANGEPAVVTVEHILIGVKPGLPNAKRDRPEAETLAFDLLKRVRDGEDFEKLGKEFTEDSSFQPYTMTNDGIEPGANETGRRSMVKAFGDTSFGLEVGQIGITDYNPENSPFGYHIIKRVK